MNQIKSEGMAIWSIRIAIGMVEIKLFVFIQNPQQFVLDKHWSIYQNELNMNYIYLKEKYK